MPRLIRDRTGDSTGVGEEGWLAVRRRARPNDGRHSSPRSARQCSPRAALSHRPITKDCGGSSPRTSADRCGPGVVYVQRGAKRIIRSSLPACSPVLLLFWSATIADAETPRSSAEIGFAVRREHGQRAFRRP
jgi:hypothetical protein